MVTYRPDDPKMDSSILVYGRFKSNSTVLARDIKIGKSYVSNSASDQPRNISDFVTEILLPVQAKNRFY